MKLEEFLSDNIALCRLVVNANVINFETFAINCHFIGECIEEFVL